MDRKSRPARHSPLETTQTSLYTFRNVFGYFSGYFGLPLSSGWGREVCSSYAEFSRNSQNSSIWNSQWQANKESRVSWDNVVMSGLSWGEASYTKRPAERITIFAVLLGTHKNRTQFQQSTIRRCLTRSSFLRQIINIWRPIPIPLPIISEIENRNM